MSYRPTDLIEVVAWGRTVGAVAFDELSGSYAFEYDDDWTEGPVELAPLLMANERGRIFTFPQMSRQTFYGLPPMLADSLPDRFGHALIDAWMTREGVSAAEVTPLDRLAYTATRAMGALEFRPPAASPVTGTTAIALAELVNAARAALTGMVGDGEDAERALADLIEVGTSAGGARPKAVIAYNPETGQIRSGQFDAPDGFEHWLLKFDGVGGDPTRETRFLDGQGYGIIEYSYFLMAREAGIDMEQCLLLPEGPRTHFMTRRFDRRGNHKVHLASLCGIAGLDFNMAGAHGYEQYLRTILDLGLGEGALEQGFRRAVFNVAAVNRDDHTKNLAFLCDEDGRWSLAPAYDLTFAWNPQGRWTASHQMSVNGKVDGITRRDLLELGERFSVPGYRGLIDDVLGAVADWPSRAADLGLDSSRVEAIADAQVRFRP